MGMIWVQTISEKQKDDNQEQLNIMGSGSQPNFMQKKIIAESSKVKPPWIKLLKEKQTRHL